ncbi:class 1 isoprenoid biosynthesis enzyme [Streptomyces sp. NPDC052496]|uniref:class 1 isoprenoid biosynthesis enzyme n=1 Tax=Streptomyces sp. NPDC052496 TaxID=3154951 RepID=UPI0034158274
MSPHPRSAAVRPSPEARLAEVFPQVRQYLAGLLDAYRPRYAYLRPALERLVAHGRRTPLECALPLLVHGAVEGTLEPAVPVAGVHTLWWRAANTFDDVSDGDVGPQLYGGAPAAVMTAALECGYALPLRALAALPVSGPLRERLVADFLDGWTAACDGQVGDLLGTPTGTGPEEVLTVYRHKSGSVYGMAATMAARLALGTPAADDPQAAAWGEFGQAVGLLAQFRNDEDDLRSGHSEDLGNRTATYLLVQLLHAATGAARDEAVELLGRAADSAADRRRLAAMMFDPDVLAPYQRLLADVHERAHTLLDTLAPASPFTAALHRRVDDEVRTTAYAVAPPGPPGTHCTLAPGPAVPPGRTQGRAGQKV